MRGTLVCKEFYLSIQNVIALCNFSWQTTLIGEIGVGPTLIM